MYPETHYSIKQYSKTKNGTEHFAQYQQKSIEGSSEKVNKNENSEEKLKETTIGSNNLYNDKTLEAFSYSKNDKYQEHHLTYCF